MRGLSPITIKNGSKMDGCARLDGGFEMVVTAQTAWMARHPVKDAISSEGCYGFG